MRIAIVSDIHANLEAFTMALADIQRMMVDEIVCLGDVAGYGPNPVDCVDIARKRFAWMICGNHDVALFMSHPIGFNKLAARAIAWHKSMLKPGFFSITGRKRWKYLETLEMKREENYNIRTLFVHGSPRDPIMEYVEATDCRDLMGPTEKMQQIFEMGDMLTFVGHSHRPGVVTNDEYEWHRPEDLPNGTWQINPAVKTLCNIGSVGQPRDGFSESCYVILDDDAATLQYRRVAYDVQTTKQKILNNPNLDDRLGARLELGR
ncbi:MAG: metallophosphoesterase family protein [Planctomycetota bacterium]